MNNVVDITKYFGRKRKTRGRPFNDTNKYCIWVERYFEEGSEYIEYMLSDDRLMNSKTGSEMVAKHLVGVLLNICFDDPELIVEVLQKIDEELGELASDD